MSSHWYRHDSGWEPYKFSSVYIHKKICKTKSVQCFADFLIKLLADFLLWNLALSLSTSSRENTECQAFCPFVGIGSPHPLTRKRGLLVATPLHLCRMGWISNCLCIYCRSNLNHQTDILGLKHLSGSRNIGNETLYMIKGQVDVSTAITFQVWYGHEMSPPPSPVKNPRKLKEKPHKNYPRL